MSSHDQYVSSRTRSRRPALIPASAFNNLESTDDLSSILPNVVHGSGCVYLLPPAGPPPELALQIRLEQSLRPPMTREYSSGSNTDMDVDSEWATSGSVTPVAASQSRIRRWSMKDLVEPDRDSLQESQFETPKQFIHKRQTSGVSEDLFSWVSLMLDDQIHHISRMH